MTKKMRRVPKDKKTGVPKKYLSGSKNKGAKAAEIKRTAEAYRKGEFIDIGTPNNYKKSENFFSKFRSKSF